MSYKYQLERAQQEISKQPYSYERRAQSITMLWNWKQVAVSNDAEALKGIMGKMHRVIDRTTGAEVYRTAPSILY